METKYPVMQVRLVRRRKSRCNVLKGACPYCGKTHTHSAGRGSAPRLGHRVSHCRRKTSQDRGYILKWDGVIGKK